MQKQDAPKYSQQSRDGLNSAAGNFLTAFAKCFPTAGSGGRGAGGGEIDLSAFGAGSLPSPPVDLGIGITTAQLQRQPDETPEQHIARITALINSVTAAMLAHAEEQKRKQRYRLPRAPPRYRRDVVEKLFCACDIGVRDFRVPHSPHLPTRQNSGVQ
jgi:hypothetical protein